MLPASLSMEILSHFLMSLPNKFIASSWRRSRDYLPLKRNCLTKYPHSAIDWEKVYSLPFGSSMESKLREFQYKILNCIVFKNEKLFRFGITQSSLCTFCQKEDESIEHLLFSCKESCEFWKHVLSWLRKNDIDVGELKEADLIFGNFDIQDDFILINHILLLGKYYIYSRKCQNAKPSLKCFIAKMKRIYSIELHIARKGEKLFFHLKKWKKLISVVANVLWWVCIMPFLFLSSPFCSALCLCMYFFIFLFFLSRMHVSYFVCVFANSIKKKLPKKK